jgi:hypothetical protein
VVDVDDDDLDKVRPLFRRGVTPYPALMKSEYIQPGRRWIPLTGPYAGQYGAEACATKDFSWIGLLFPGEDMYHAFPIEELKEGD